MVREEGNKGRKREAGRENEKRGGVERGRERGGGERGGEVEGEGGERGKGGAGLNIIIQAYLSF